MDLVDIEVTCPSGQPDVAQPVKPSPTIRSGGSTPIPDLLIEAAQIANNNNAASSSSCQDPDVYVTISFFVDSNIVTTQLLTFVFLTLT